MSTGLAISATMLAGPAVWGGIGYLIDSLAGTGKVFMAIGMIVGAAGAAYIVYLKYGRQPEPAPHGTERAESAGGHGEQRG
jgi:F0F1-type ATP synthase assembly protein I